MTVPKNVLSLSAGKIEKLIVDPDMDADQSQNVVDCFLCLEADPFQKNMNIDPQLFD